MKMKQICSVMLALLIGATVGDAFATEAMPQLTPPPMLGTVIEEILPENAALSPYDPSIAMEIKKYDELEAVDSLKAEQSISFMHGSRYTELEGVTTFRGNNFRDSGAYGVVPSKPSSLEIEYSIDIGGIDKWSGVGWTGQASAVRWPEETRRIMNIYDGKKDKDGLIEVIYATLDGHIYFFDMEDGEPTRDPINIGAPVKGSVTVDPRGYPLLYCGQGIDTVNEKSVEIGMRVFSLITGERLLFIDGHDKVATRGWFASDCAPLVHAETDTLLWAGENGLFYRIKLNTAYDPQTPSISIDPEIDRYWYASRVTTRPGMENSFSVYNHYAFLPDNSGLMQCLDIDTLEPVWAVDLLDDTDSSPALEVDGDDQLWIYTGSEYDQGAEEKCYIRRINGFTGEVDWCIEFGCRDSDYGGAYATPAIGKGSAEELVYFTQANTKEGNFLIAVEKQTGVERWRYDMGAYSWSSPTLCLDEHDNAYLVVCNAGGMMRLIDAVSGKKLAECQLNANIEGSPIVFDDMVVVGTRGSKIYGVKIR